MEDTLREYMKTKTVFYLRVLILVLMEDTLRAIVIDLPDEETRRMF